MIKILNRKYYIYRVLITQLIILNLLLNQILWAGGADRLLQNNPNKQDLYRDGQEVLAREQYQEERLKEIEAIRDLVHQKEEKVDLLEEINKTLSLTKEVQAINEQQRQNTIQTLRSNSKRIENSISSRGEKYQKYGDGKKVWTLNGLVTAIENEVIYDKKGNRSLRNTWDMKYNKDKKMVSYQASTKDSLGNQTTVQWGGAKYWKESDEDQDQRKKAGQLASFTEERTNEIGVTTTTQWKEIKYYSEEDQQKSEEHQEGQMSSYQKEEVSSATPDRIDQIQTTEITYQKREKQIFEKSDDPKEKERRKSKESRYETLMVSFKEKRNTFGIETEREWKDAKYNPYSELIYYQESSNTQGVQSDKEFKNAQYDQRGRITSFQEEIKSYGSTQIRQRQNIIYNDKNQILSYQDQIDEEGVKTSIHMKDISYNVNGQMLSYTEITQTSEDYKRELSRSEMLYDTRGLITHYLDRYQENGLHIRLERDDIDYNQHGQLYSYKEKRREQGSYKAPDGETIEIDRKRETRRHQTKYNQNGLVQSYKETKIDPLGLKTEIHRYAMKYQGKNLTSYEETRDIFGTLKQNTLEINDLDQFKKDGVNYIVREESIDYHYQIKKKFYGGKYKKGKLISYTEEVQDSRKGGVTTKTQRNNQKYGKNGKVSYYEETVTTKGGEGESTQTRIWKDGNYDKMGRLQSYREITRNNLGGETKRHWQADQYNPISLIQSYTESIQNENHIVKKKREAIKYNSYDLQLYYQEQVTEGSGTPYQNKWEAKGYNSVGLVTGTTTTTIKGLMTQVNERLYISYNSQGYIQQYVDILLETANYKNPYDIDIQIDRKTVTERTKTEFDQEGRPQEFIEWKYQPNGLEIKTHRKEMTYTKEGNLASYQEQQYGQGEFTQAELQGYSQSLGATLGAAQTINYSYLIEKEFKNGIYNGNNQLQSYEESSKDTRRGKTEINIKRSNQTYNSQGKIESYQEEKIEKNQTHESLTKTHWKNATYTVSGQLKSYQEETTDSVGSQKQKYWEALSYNPIDLVLSSKEETQILDGSQKAITIKTKTKQSYDHLDQQVAYEEEHQNGRGYKTQKVWQGDYMELGLLRGQQSIERDGHLIKTSHEQHKNYDHSGRILREVKEESEMLEAGQPLNLLDYSDPKFVQILGKMTTPPTVPGGSYLKESSQYRSQTIYDEYGQEAETIETHTDEHGNQSHHHKENIIHNGAGIQQSYSETSQYTETPTALAPAGIQYTLQRSVENQAFGTHGLPSQTLETITDTRKPGLTKTIQKSDMTYDTTSQLSHYKETITQKDNIDGSILNTNEEKIRNTTYQGSNQIQSYTESITQDMAGTDGQIQKVTQTITWLGQDYNLAGQVIKYTETTTQGDSTTRRQRENILYNQQGQQSFYYEKTEESSGLETYKTWQGSYQGTQAGDFETVQTNSQSTDLYKTTLRNQIQYNNLGQQISYYEDQREQGDWYYQYNNQGIGQGVPINVDRTSTHERLQSSYNNYGQITLQEDRKINAQGIQEDIQKTNIQYSPQGQEVSYRESTQVSDSTGAIPYSYQTQKTQEIISYNPQGLVKESREVLEESRSPQKQSQTHKSQITYNSNNQLYSYQEDQREINLGGSVTLNTRTQKQRHSTIYNNKGQITQYQEEIWEDKNRLQDQNNNPLTQTHSRKTWEGDYYQGSSLLKSSDETLEQLDENDQVQSQSQSQKDQILYNNLDQETSYQKEDSLGVGPESITSNQLTENISYDHFGRQKSYTTIQTQEGITKTIHRQNISYRNQSTPGSQGYGNIDSYQEHQREQSTPGNPIQIDRYSQTQRVQTQYNSLGQIQGYLQNQWTAIPTDTLIPDWTATAIPSDSKRIQTQRDQMVYTEKNQLIQYQDQETVTATLRTRPIDIQAQSGTNPGAPTQTERPEEITQLNYQITKTTQIQELDSIGRNKKTRQTQEDSRRPAIQKIIKKEIEQYSPQNQIESYTETNTELDIQKGGAELSTTQIQRQNTTYIAGTRLPKSYQETRKKYIPNPGQASNQRSQSTIHWQGEYYQDGAGENTQNLKSTSTEEIKYSETIPNTWAPQLKTLTQRGQSAQDQSVQGINYNQLGQNLSYSDITTRTSLDQNGQDLETLSPETKDMAQIHYDPSGNISSYTQEKGIQGEPDSFTSTTWERGQYNQLGQSQSYFQIQTDLFGVQTYTSYQDAQYDNYGRLIAYDKRDIQYTPNTGDNTLKPGETIHAGINTQTTTHWEADPDPAQAFDDEGRNLKSQKTIDQIQGNVHTYSQVQTTLTYNPKTGLVTESLETKWNRDPQNHGNFYSRRDSRTSQITYDNFGRQKSYQSQVHFGGNQNGGNALQDQRQRESIIYDNKNRLLRYQETVDLEKYIDVDNYAIFRANTQYGDYGDANNHGKVKDYTNYTVKIDEDQIPTPTYTQAITAFLNDVGADYAGLPSDSTTDAYIYEKENMKTQYHKVGLAFKTEDKIGTVDIHTSTDIWKEEEEREFDMGVDPRPKTEGIQLNKLSILGDSITLGITKGDIIYQTDYDPAQDIDTTIQSFTLGFKIHKLDGDGNIQSTQDITDITNMSFGADGKVSAYDDTFTQNGTTHNVSHWNITYNEEQFASYMAEITPPLGPTSYLKREIQQSGDDLIVTDTYYQTNQQDIDGNYQSAIRQTNQRTFGADGQLKGFQSTQGNLTTSYQIQSTSGGIISYSQIETIDSKGTADTSDDTIHRYKITSNDPLGQATAYNLYTVDPVTLVESYQEGYQNISYYNGTEPDWQDFDGNSHPVVAGEMASYDQVDELGTTTKEVRNIHYDGAHNAVEAEIDGVRMSVGGGIVRHFFRNGSIYYNIRQGPPLQYNRVTFFGFSNRLYDVTHTGGNLTGYRKGNQTYSDITGYNQGTGQVDSYSLNDNGTQYNQIHFDSQNRVSQYQQGGKTYTLSYQGNTNTVDQVNITLSGQIYENVTFDNRGRLRSFTLNGDNYSQLNYTTSNGNTLRNFQLNGQYYDRIQTNASGQITRFRIQGNQYENLQYTGNQLTSFRLNGATYNNITATGNTIQSYEQGGHQYGNFTYTGPNLSEFTRDGKTYTNLVLDGNNRLISYQEDGIQYSNIQYSSGTTIQNYSYNGQSYSNISTNASGQLTGFQRGGRTYSNIQYSSHPDISSYQVSYNTTIDGESGTITETIINDGAHTRVQEYSFNFTANLGQGNQNYTINYSETTYDPATSTTTYDLTPPAFQPPISLGFDPSSQLPIPGTPLAPANPGNQISQSSPVPPITRKPIVPGMPNYPIPQGPPYSSELRGGYRNNFSQTLDSGIEDITPFIPSPQDIEQKLVGDYGQYQPTSTQTNKDRFQKEQYIARIPGNVTLLTETTEKYYNAYGQAESVITKRETKRFDLSADQESSANQTSQNRRTNIQLNQRGLQNSYQETVINADGTQKLIQRKSTQYDQVGNVIGYIQVITRTLSQSIQRPQSSQDIQEEDQTLSDAKENQEKLKNAKEKLKNYGQKYDNQIVQKGTETLTETVTGLKYDDKQQLLEYNKSSQIQKEGTDQEGETVTYTETQETSETYSYDQQGRIASSQSQSTSSHTPDLITKVDKSNMVYDSKGQLLSYDLSQSNLAQGLKEELVLLSQDIIRRNSTQYDGFGRQIGYQETRSNTNATQNIHIHRRGITFGKYDRISSFIESSKYQGSQYQTLQAQKNIKYDQEGRQISWEQIHQEQDQSLGINITQITQRKQTLIDAFGNQASYLEKTLALSPASNFIASQFFQGGTYQAGIVSQIQFEGGKYDSIGRYTGYRQSTQSTYGNIEDAKNWTSQSITERVYQKQNKLGQTIESQEKTWNSQAPDLITQSTVSNITYNQKGQKTGETRTTHTQGTFNNPNTGQAHQYNDQRTTQISDIRYDQKTGLQNQSTTTYTEENEQEKIQETIIEKILEQNPGGRAQKTLTQRTVTQSLNGQENSYTEESIKTLNYTQDGRVQKESIQSTITQGQETLSQESTQIENHYDQQGRVIEQNIQSENHLANIERKQQGQNPVKEQSQRQNDYHPNGQLKNTITLNQQINKSTGTVRTGQVSIENNIQYTGAGTKSSWESLSYQVKKQEKQTPLKLDSIQETISLETPLETKPIVPSIGKLLSISVAGAIKSKLQGTGETNPTQGQTLQQLDLSKLTPLQNSRTEIQDFDSKGLSKDQTTEGTKYRTHNGQLIQYSYKTQRSKQERNLQGQLKSMEETSQSQGDVEKKSKLLDRQYNALGQITQETRATQVGETEGGEATYKESTKKNISYNHQGQTQSYTLDQKHPSGYTTQIQRLESHYDQEGRLTQSKTKTNYIDQNGQEIQSRYSETQIKSFDENGDVKEQSQKSGVIIGQQEGEYLLSKGTEQQSQTSYQYDQLGRTLKTTTQTTNGYGEVSVTEKENLELDPEGRILHSQSKTVDHQGKITSQETKNIKYDHLNRRTQEETLRNDKDGNITHLQKYGIKYDRSGKEKEYRKKDYPDSHKANTNEILTTHITYDAAGRRSSYTQTGIDRDDKHFSEHRSNMKYNQNNQLQSFSSTGHNNGYTYSYDRENISYYEDNSESYERGQVKSYTEKGVTDNGQVYQETHDEIKYDQEGRVTSKHVKGRKAGESFDEDRSSSYYEKGHQFEGRLKSSQSKSRNNQDHNQTYDLQYDQQGNTIHSKSKGVNKGKSFQNTLDASYKKFGNFYRASSKRERGQSDGKSYDTQKSGMVYNSQGKLRAYNEKGKDYQRSVSKVSYDGMGRKSKITFTDTRYKDFKSGGNTVTESYRYNSEGKKTGSTLTTADYIINFNGEGKKIGDPQETQSFKARKDKEIRKAKAAARRRARRRAEAARRRAEANARKAYDANGNEVNLGGQPGRGQYNMRSILHGGREYGHFSKSIIGRGRGYITHRTILRGMIAQGPNGQNLLTLNFGNLLNQLAAKALGQLKMPQIDMGALIRKELSKIRINTPKLDKNAISNAVKNAIKIAFPEINKNLKGIKTIENFTKSLLSNPNIKLDDNLNITMANGENFADLKSFSEELGKLDGVEFMENSKFDELPPFESFFNDYGTLKTVGGEDVAWPITFYDYDDQGNLSSSYKLEKHTNDEGMTTTSVTKDSYDKDGYVTDTISRDHVYGPNGDYYVDSQVNADGTRETHIHGQQKNSMGGWEPINETRKSKTVAIKGGFKVITDITDNLTGLKCKKTDTYTGVRYHKGKMIEFNLTSEVKGQRLQNKKVWKDVEIQLPNGKTKTQPMEVQVEEIVDIHTVSKTRQYGAKIDGQGRLYEYKQDLWNNSSPAKNTTRQVNITEFDGQDRARSQTTQTWEKGKGTNAAGEEYTLDSYSVACRDTIEYDSKGNVTSYNETTYKQQPLDQVGAAANAGQTDDISSKTMRNRMLAAGMLKDGDTTAIAGQTESGIDGTVPVGTSLQVNGQTKKASDGHVWGAENTSQRGMSYNHNGDLQWYISSNGDANYNQYDHLDLVKSSVNGDTRTYNIAYDSVGRREQWQTKQDGKQSTYGTHKAAYNELGHMTWKRTELKSNGKKYKMHKITEETFKYDKQGIQSTLWENKIKDSFKKKTTIGQIITIVVAIIATIISFGAAAPALFAAVGMSAAAAGATIAAVGAMVGAAVDGGSVEDCLKAGAIAFVTTYVGGQVAGGAGKAFTEAVKTGTTTTVLATGATYVAQQTAVNLAVNLLSGQKGSKALKGAFYSALGTVVAAGLAANFSSGTTTITDRVGENANILHRDINWGNLGKEMVKDFAGNFLEGAFNAYGQGSDWDDAFETGAAKGLASIALNSIGLALQTTGGAKSNALGQSMTTKGPVGSSSVESAIESRLVSNVVSQANTIIYQELSKEMGDREAQFAAGVLSQWMGAGLNDMNPDNVKDETSPDYVNSFADALAQNVIDYTLVGIMEKVTKEGQFGREFALAFADAFANQFTVAGFKKALIKYRAKENLVKTLSENPSKYANAKIETKETRGKDGKLAFEFTVSGNGGPGGPGGNGPNGTGPDGTTFETTFSNTYGKNGETTITELQTIIFNKSGGINAIYHKDILLAELGGASLGEGEVIVMSEESVKKGLPTVRIGRYEENEKGETLFIPSREENEKEKILYNDKGVIQERTYKDFEVVESFDDQGQLVKREDKKVNAIWNFKDGKAISLFVDGHQIGGYVDKKLLDLAFGEGKISPEVLKSMGLENISVRKLQSPENGKTYLVLVKDGKVLEAFRPGSEQIRDDLGRLLKSYIKEEDGTINWYDKKGQFEIAFGKYQGHDASFLDENKTILGALYKTETSEMPAMVEYYGGREKPYFTEIIGARTTSPIEIKAGNGNGLVHFRDSLQMLETENGPRVFNSMGIELTVKSEVSGKIDNDKLFKALESATEAGRSFAVSNIVVAEDGLTRAEGYLPYIIENRDGSREQIYQKVAFFGEIEQGKAIEIYENLPMVSMASTLAKGTVDQDVQVFTGKGVVPMKSGSNNFKVYSTAPDTKGNKEQFILFDVPPVNIKTKSFLLNTAVNSLGRALDNKVVYSMDGALVSKVPGYFKDNLDQNGNLVGFTDTSIRSYAQGNKITEATIKTGLDYDSLSPGLKGYLKPPVGVQKDQYSDIDTQLTFRGVIPEYYREDYTKELINALPHKGMDVQLKISTSSVMGGTSTIKQKAGESTEDFLNRTGLNEEEKNRIRAVIEKSLEGTDAHELAKKYDGKKVDSKNYGEAITTVNDKKASDPFASVHVSVDYKLSESTRTLYSAMISASKEGEAFDKDKKRGSTTYYNLDGTKEKVVYEKEGVQEIYRGALAPQEVIKKSKTGGDGVLTSSTKYEWSSNNALSKSTVTIKDEQGNTLDQTITERKMFNQRAVIETTKSMNYYVSDGKGGKNLLFTAKAPIDQFGNFDAERATFFTPNGQELASDSGLLANFKEQVKQSNQQLKDKMDDLGGRLEKRELFKTLSYQEKAALQLSEKSFWNEDYKKSENANVGLDWFKGAVVEQNSFVASLKEWGVSTWKGDYVRTEEKTLANNIGQAVPYLGLTVLAFTPAAPFALGGLALLGLRDTLGNNSNEKRLTEDILKDYKKGNFLDENKLGEAIHFRDEARINKYLSTVQTVTSAASAATATYLKILNTSVKAKQISDVSFRTTKMYLSGTNVVMNVADGVALQVTNKIALDSYFKQVEQGKNPGITPLLFILGQNLVFGYFSGKGVSEFGSDIKLRNTPLSSKAQAIQGRLPKEFQGKYYAVEAENGNLQFFARKKGVDTPDLRYVDGELQKLEAGKFVKVKKISESSLTYHPAEFDLQPKSQKLMNRPGEQSFQSVKKGSQSLDTPNSKNMSVEAPKQKVEYRLKSDDSLQLAVKNNGKWGASFDDIKVLKGRAKTPADVVSESFPEAIRSKYSVIEQGGEIKIIKGHKVDGPDFVYKEGQIFRVAESGDLSPYYKVNTQHEAFKSLGKGQTGYEPAHVIIKGGKKATDNFDDLVGISVIKGEGGDNIIPFKGPTPPKAPASAAKAAVKADGLEKQTFMAEIIEIKKTGTGDEVPYIYYQEIASSKNPDLLGYNLDDPVSQSLYLKNELGLSEGQIRIVQSVNANSKSKDLLTQKFKVNDVDGQNKIIDFKNESSKSPVTPTTKEQTPEVKWGKEVPNTEPDPKYGLSFIGEDSYLNIVENRFLKKGITPKTHLPGKYAWFGNKEVFKNASSLGEVHTMTGGAPGTCEAMGMTWDEALGYFALDASKYTGEKRLFFVETPFENLVKRKPTSLESGGGPHFIEQQGTTGLNTGGENPGIMLNVGKSEIKTVNRTSKKIETTTVDSKYHEYIVQGGQDMPIGTKYYEAKFKTNSAGETSMERILLWEIGEGGVVIDHRE